MMCLKREIEIVLRVKVVRVSIIVSKIVVSQSRASPVVTRCRIVSPRVIT